MTYLIMLVSSSYNMNTPNFNVLFKNNNNKNSMKTFQTDRSDFFFHLAITVNIAQYAQTVILYFRPDYLLIFFSLWTSAGWWFPSVERPFLSKNLVTHSLLLLNMFLA